MVGFVGIRRRRTGVVLVITGALLIAFIAFIRFPGDGAGAPDRPTTSPPRADGYFRLRPVGAWRRLPGDGRCAELVRRSTWEPRPDNDKANHRMPLQRAVHAALAERPVSGDGAYDPRWDRWLLQRVTGHFTGTTDEILQWGACKWGLPDNVLRAVAVRESTWYQALVYPGGRCVTNYGCGDLVTTETRATEVFCAGISRYGYDYRADYSDTGGTCPKTFGLTGVMAWQAPAWGAMADNQNGTFPFSRNSTAYTVDYLGAQLRGCFEGWERWLRNTGDGTYEAGRLWGCIGAWYAGDWRSAAARGYMRRVLAERDARTWLTRDFRSDKPPCHPTYGCPVGR